MNFTVIMCDDDVSFNCDHIYGVAFDNAVIGAKSALLPVICAVSSPIRDNCAHLSTVLHAFRPRGRYT